MMISTRFGSLVAMRLARHRCVCAIASQLRLKVATMTESTGAINSDDCIFHLLASSLPGLLDRPLIAALRHRRRFCWSAVAVIQEFGEVARIRGPLGGFPQTPGVWNRTPVETPPYPHEIAL